MNCECAAAVCCNWLFMRVVGKYGDGDVAYSVGLGQTTAGADFVWW